MDVKKLIHEEARLPEETVPICLRGDLVARFEKLERELEEAERRPATSLAGNGARAIAEQIEQLRAQMAEATVTFVLRAMPDEEWYEFAAAHPPRRDDAGDVDERDQLGVNAETFWPALVRRSVVDPVLDDDDWRALLGDRGADKSRREAAGEPVEKGKLTAKQRRSLNTAAWNLNQKDVDIPFSFAASRTLNSEPGSRRPNDSGSPSPDSTDVSTPPDTSTTTPVG